MQRSTSLYALPIAAMTTLSVSAFAQDYTVVQIPNLPGWPNMAPNDINDKGEVTGNGFEPWGWVNRAFYWDGTATHDFTAALIDAQKEPFIYTRGLSINNHSHILFNLELVDVGVFPYIWTGGTNYRKVTPELPPNSDAGANWINNHGVVAGAIRQFICCWDLRYRGFLWDMNTDETIIIDPPPPYTDSTAVHVSDNGWVTGYVSGGDSVARGYLWKDGEFTLMEPLDQEDYLSISQRVNSAGIAAGFSTNQPPMGTPSMSRVLLWNATDGITQAAYPIDGLSGFQVRGMNETNEVVGTMYGPQQSFHWHNGVLRNLNNHITSPLPGTTLDIWEAGGVNNSGQIAVEANYLGSGDWNNYAFVLTLKSSCVPADLNCDDVVDVLDMLMLFSAWGPCPGAGGGNDSACPADLNGDEVVDVIDMLILFANWG